jgi:hypothetical protein
LSPNDFQFMTLPPVVIFERGEEGKDSIVAEEMD